MLTFSGRGAAFNTLGGNNSAYIKKDGTLFLLDCGETVFSTLKNSGVLDGVSEIFTVITHLHADHCGSLASLVLYSKSVLGFPVKLILPRKDEYVSQIKTLLSVMGAPEGVYEIIPEDKMSPAAGINGVKYMRTRHAPALEYCWSLSLDTVNGYVFYSGDTADTKTVLEFISEHPDFYRMYVDLGDAEGEKVVHLPMTVLAAALTDEQKAKTWAMHLSTPHSDEKCLRLGFNVAVCG